MLGAIIGDICGSVYERFNQKDENKVKMFCDGCFPTDDSIMTAAVSRALLDADGMSDQMVKEALVTSMHYFGHLFPNAGYGGNFRRWLRHYSRDHYNSFGNGSAMRVSSAGWIYPTLEKTLHMARLTAEVTHSHPDGIKGAQSIAAAIFLARTGKSKEEIQKFINSNFYDMDFSLDDIRSSYVFNVTCQGSCPEAIKAFLEGEDFEGVVRKAISIGGDSDTIAAMAGGIAEAYYGIPKAMEEKAFDILKQVKSKGRVYNDHILQEEVQRMRKNIV